MYLQWWKETLGGWKHILCSVLLHEILSWAFKRKLHGDMASQKEMNQKTELISKATS